MSLRGFGAYDPSVASVQAALNDLGIGGGIAEDGIWGPQTQGAVQAFRATAGLPADVGGDSQGELLDSDFSEALLNALYVAGIPQRTPGVGGAAGGAGGTASSFTWPSLTIPSINTTIPTPAGAPSAAPAGGPSLPIILGIGAAGLGLYLLMQRGGGKKKVSVRGSGGSQAYRRVARHRGRAGSHHRVTTKATHYTRTLRSRRR